MLDSNSSTAIEAAGLSKFYGNFAAIRDVSFVVPAGQVTAFLGPNGAGKSTTLKILTGYLTPTSGTARIAGLDVQTDRIRAAEKLGYLPENAPLYAEQTVADYLLGMATLRGVPAAKRVAAVAEAAADVGLHGRLGQRIGTLSKGLRQRVGIAQAIVHRPDVLILDEPTNGLDPSQIASIRELVLRLAERSTVLLSTHILQEVEAVCDRVIVLVGGRLVADGPLSELTRTAALRLSVQGPANVAAVAGAVPGVTGVQPLGDDPDLPGFSIYLRTCAPGGALPAPQVAGAVQAAGLTLGTLAPARRRLEDAFEDLSRQVHA